MWRDDVFGGGPEGIAYVPLNSPLFPNPTVLIAEYDNNTIAAYDIDLNGLPIFSSRKVFLSGATGVEGIAFDSATGDLLFSMYSDTHVYSVQATPEPGTIGLLAAGLLGIIGIRRRRRK